MSESGNLWNQADVPHKGWECVDVEDVTGDDGDPDERNYESCQMCGNERVRYIHTMQNPDFPHQLRVGRICASKMSNDYIGPASREHDLKLRSRRRIAWTKKLWRTSASGNLFVNSGGYNIVIFPKKNSIEKWSYRILNRDTEEAYFSEQTYDSQEAAVSGSFEKYEELRMEELEELYGYQ